MLIFTGTDLVKGGWPRDQRRVQLGMRPFGRLISWNSERSVMPSL